MGKSLYDAHASVRRLFEEASDVLGKDLRALCFEGPEAVLVQTDNVQPAITLVSLVCLRVLREAGVEPAVVAGHSVGEYAALCAAGVLSFADTIRLVGVRGTAMRTEAERHPGTMAAVIGLTADVLTSVCDEVGADVVQVANHNAPGQIVITGTADGVRDAGKAAKARGAKLIVPLKVSGPWHSRFMAGAQAALRTSLDACTVNVPTIDVFANTTAAPHAHDPAAIRNELVRQIVSPVLWSQSVTAMLDAGCRTFVEVGPGRALSGMFKEYKRDVSVMNVQDTDSLARVGATVGRPQA
jgi:[acyl-carrier-protein] S-malonyltransferase